MSSDFLGEWLAARINVFSGNLVWKALGETLTMVGVSGTLAVLVGVPLGVILVITSKNGLRPNPVLNACLGGVVNVTRSIPFIILCIYIMPLTKLLVGGTIGTKGSIPPLAIAAIPFMARMAEVSFKEVPSGLIEAAQSMGATTMQIIRKVLIAESLPSLVSGITIMLVALIGYSAIVGTVGGGGLGTVAINYGHARYRGDVMDAVVLIIIVLVVIVQLAGDWIAAKVNHR